MKTRALLLTVIFALLIVSVSAQEPTPEYRLRVPTVEEYLNQVIEIATENDGDNLGLYSTVTTILFNHFPELYKAGFDRLLEAYNRMNIGSGQFWQRREWVNLLILAWLSENQPDLNAVDRLDFADFYIGVIHRDLDGDGQNEFVLDVMKGAPVDRHECPSIDVVEYLAVEQTGNEYTFINNPLGWYGRGSGGGSHLGEGGQQELRFEDVNGDSLPEWIVAENNGVLGGPDAGYANHGQLYILNYRDGQLVDLARNADSRGNVYSVTDYYEDSGWCLGPIPRTVSWEFSNIDFDPALEILQYQDYRDNWYCESRSTQTLDWNPEADQYQYLHTDQSFADTRNCAHRLAEEAMWAGNYTKAIEQYERALTLEPYRYNFPENYATEHADYVAQENERLHHILTRLDQYLRARLILAYVLTGQPDQAQPLLNELSAEKMETQLIGYFVDALKSAPVNNSLQTCLAAYDVFTQHFFYA
ncbi:MAG TPA: hypothetical protein VHO69_16415 [Phototrophicaceae bacterium]|nr:hypothetical protein [Phototrophicaceae bacterium]